MSLHDILTTVANTADLKFTADNTVTFITIVPGNRYVFQNASSNDIFQDGDNLLLKKIHFILPYQYGGADHVRINSFRLVWNQNAAIIPIPEVGEFGIVRLAPLSVVLEPNIKLNAPVPGDGNFTLEVDNIDISISQIYGPDALQDADVFFGIALEIVHTIEMI